MHLHPVPWWIPATPAQDALYEFFKNEIRFTANMVTYLVLGMAYVDWPNVGLEGVGRYLLAEHGL